MESFRTLKQLMNLTSSRVQSSSCLCLALAFCWMKQGETCLMSMPCFFGSTSTPCSSSWSHLACIRSWHFLLNWGTQIL